MAAEVVEFDTYFPFGLGWERIAADFALGLMLIAHCCQSPMVPINFAFIPLGFAGKVATLAARLLHSCFQEARIGSPERLAVVITRGIRTGINYFMAEVGLGYYFVEGATVTEGYILGLRLLHLLLVDLVPYFSADRNSAAYVGDLAAKSMDYIDSFDTLQTGRISCSWWSFA